ncbi:platelet binding protein GspB-like [Palaemon carinicauda]|uniref:platelet binding protein GspB-like n=1 Tax=Palaemon carinicauda TaxID=392227 RepID=UPI0035B61D9F
MVTSSNDGSPIEAASYTGIAVAGNDVAAAGGMAAVPDDTPVAAGIVSAPYEAAADKDTAPDVAPGGIVYVLNNAIDSAASMAASTAITTAISCDADTKGEAHASATVGIASALEDVFAVTDDSAAALVPAPNLLLNKLLFQVRLQNSLDAAPDEAATSMTAGLGEAAGSLVAIPDDVPDEADPERDAASIATALNNAASSMVTVPDAKVAGKSAVLDDAANDDDAASLTVAQDDVAASLSSHGSSPDNDAPPNNDAFAGLAASQDYNAAARIAALSEDDDAFVFACIAAQPYDVVASGADDTVLAVVPMKDAASKIAPSDDAAGGTAVVPEDDAAGGRAVVPYDAAGGIATRSNSVPPDEVSIVACIADLPNEAFAVGAMFNPTNDASTEWVLVQIIQLPARMLL